jgi:hypothetical protein
MRKGISGSSGVLCTPSLCTKKGNWIVIQYLLSGKGAGGAWTNELYRHQSKMSSSKKIDL